MSKKQTSILSFFKPKGEVTAKGSSGPIESKKKKKKYDNLDFIFLSSDSDDDSEIQVVGSRKESNTASNDKKPLKKKEDDDLNHISDSNSFCDTEQFMSVTFEEGDEEMITDSIKISIADLVYSGEVDDYKWSSFREMIDWTLKDKANEHLFNDEDWSVVQKFTSLSVLSQRLYIRLFVRRRRWIRPSRMDYKDLGSDLQPLIDELVKSKFLFNCDSISDLREGLELLNPTELKSLVKSFNGIGGVNSKVAAKIPSTLLPLGGKNWNVGSLIESFEYRVKKILGSSAYSINDEMSRLFSRMTYLYYPPQVNEDENGVVLSHELLNSQQVELGNLRYPSYNINKNEIIYKTRQDLIEYETACRLESRILVAIEKRDAESVINKYLPEAREGFNLTINNIDKGENQNLPNFLRNQTAGHVFTRCLHHIVTVLEQQKKHAVAVEVLNMVYDQDLYCQHYKGIWLERLAINYETHLKRPDDAFKAVKKGLKDPNVHFAFRYTLYVRTKKLSKSSKVKSVSSIPTCPEYEFPKCKEVTIFAHTLLKTVNGRKTIFIDPKATGDFPRISVEQAAMNHYLANGYAQGLHTESAVYHALLGLFFWDIIYQDVADAFRFKNQKLPLDFVSNNFYIRRQNVVEERLQLIRSATLDEMYLMMDNVWGSQMGCVSIIAWDSSDISQLKEIVCCLGNDPLVAICERLLKHFRFTRSGFPDLIVWDITSRKIKAVEVKGPGDSLSSKQILWLEYFNNCSLPAEVCYVKAAK